MKKILLTLIAVLVLTISNGQNYKVIKGDTINRLDKKWKKQGIWIFFNEGFNPVMKCIYKNNEVVGYISTIMTPN